MRRARPGRSRVKGSKLQESKGNAKEDTDKDVDKIKDSNKNKVTDKDKDSRDQAEAREKRLPSQQVQSKITSSTGNNYVILKPKFLNKDSTFDQILQSYDAVDVSSKPGQDLMRELSSEGNGFEVPAPVAKESSFFITQGDLNKETNLDSGYTSSVSPYVRANSRQPKNLLRDRQREASKEISNVSSLKSVDILKSAKIHKPVVDTNLRKPKKADTTGKYQLLEIYNENPLTNSLEDFDRFEEVGEKVVRIARD